MRRAVGLLALALAGCTSAPVPDDAAREIERFAVREQGPAATLIAAWYAGTQRVVACAEVASPPALGGDPPTLRLTYDLTRHDGQVEYHRRWTGDEATMAIVVNNRMIFDNLWRDQCAPYAPAGRRFAHLIGR